jgi:hypothetical protein
MQGLTIEIPGDIVATMKLPRKRIKEHLLIDIASSLYQLVGFRLILKISPTSIFKVVTV